MSGGGKDFKDRVLAVLGVLEVLSGSVVLGRPMKAWPGEIDGADVVINLAGRSVNCRYTKKNRDEILESRVASVRAVGQAIRDAKRPPAVWLQASTATIYAHRYDAPNDEATGGTRKVKLRSGPGAGDAGVADVTLRSRPSPY